MVGLHLREASSRLVRRHSVTHADQDRDILANHYFRLMGLFYPMKSASITHEDVDAHWQLGTIRSHLEALIIVACMRKLLTTLNAMVGTG